MSVDRILSQVLGSSVASGFAGGVGAAQADGKLDGDERRIIFDRVNALDVSSAEKAELFSQLEKPVDLQTLVNAAKTPELAAEIYTASLLAIEVDSAAERGYLAMLAARLDVPEGLVAAIHDEIETGGIEERSQAQAL